MASFFIMHRGFSFGIIDVTPGKQLVQAKNNLLDSGYIFIFQTYLRKVL